MSHSSTLHLRERGQGLPVLALHDGRASGFHWTALADHLQGQARVLAPDLHGHGMSPDWPARSIASMDVDADPLAAWLLDAGRPVHLVGHGHGGALALWLALRLPTRVRALTLVEPAPLGLLHRLDGAEDRAWAREAAEITGWVETLLRAGRVLAATRTHVCHWRGPLVWALMNEAERNVAAARMAAVVRQQRAALAAAWSPQRLAGLRVPVKLVRAHHAHRITRALARALADLLPEATTTSVHVPADGDPFTPAPAVLAATAQHVKTVAAGAMADAAWRFAAQDEREPAAALAA